MKKRKAGFQSREPLQEENYFWLAAYFFQASLVACSAGDTVQCPAVRRHRFDPCVGKIPQRRKWQPTPVFLPGGSHGQRSLRVCSPWGRKELDETEHVFLQALFLEFSVLLIYMDVDTGTALNLCFIRNMGSNAT